jgi:hypothetical protein
MMRSASAPTTKINVAPDVSVSATSYIAKAVLFPPSMPGSRVYVWLLCVLWTYGGKVGCECECLRGRSQQDNPKIVTLPCGEVARPKDFTKADKKTHRGTATLMILFEVTPINLDTRPTPNSRSTSTQHAQLDGNSGLQSQAPGVAEQTTPAAAIPQPHLGTLNVLTQGVLTSIAYFYPVLIRLYDYIDRHPDQFYGEEIVTPEMRPQLAQMRALNSPYLRQQPRDDGAAGESVDSAVRRVDSAVRRVDSAVRRDSDAGEGDNDPGKVKNTREGMNKDDEADSE